ncbi:MAG: cupin domain-containing protein [Rhizobiaceae bacterium]
MAATAGEAEAIIAALGLEPHPEGGWYAETFRDPEGGARGHSTAIYFLLKAGEESAWHRVRDAAEVWHHYAGAPLRLQVSGDLAEVHTLVLGTGLEAGERPQHVVPAGQWQRAKSFGEWTLVGCTVAPGFDFAAFEMVT